MDLTHRVEDIRLCSGVGEEETGKLIKKLITDVLQEVLDSGHDLGGMGEYGRGWNDKGVQMRILVSEMIGRWSSET